MLRGLTNGGHRASMKFQVTDVHKALGAVGKMTGAGHRVVFDEFDEEGSYILHRPSMLKTPLTKRNGIFTFEIAVDVDASKEATRASSVATEKNAKRPFPRQR